MARERAKRANLTKLLRDEPNRRRRVAVHEAGHALAASMWGCDVETVSIHPDSVSSGRVTRRCCSARSPNFLARTTCLPYRRYYALTEMIVNMAGYAAEEVVLGGIEHHDVRSFFDTHVPCTFEADHDISKAFEFAAVAYRQNGVARVLRQYEVAKAYLLEHRDPLDDLVRALLDREELTEDDVKEIVGDRIRVRRWSRRTTSRAFLRLWS